MFINVELTDMPMDEYHAHPAYNMSLLNVVADQSVAHMLVKRDKPNVPTEAMRFGTMFHKALLEPEKYSAYIIPAMDKRTKEYKAAVAAIPEEQRDSVITQDEADSISAMLAAIKSDTLVNSVLSKKTFAEKCIFATHESTGLRVKARLDFYTKEFGGYGIDLKTTEDASPSGFRSSIYKYRYYRSYAFYSDMLKASNLKFSEYRLLAVEKSAPYGFSFWTIGEMLFMKGRKEYDGALHEIAQYERTGVAKTYLNEDGKPTFECL